MSKRTSVIIAGAGPIGLTAALLLGSKDIRVTVLEADDRLCHVVGLVGGDLGP